MKSKRSVKEVNELANKIVDAIEAYGEVDGQILLTALAYVATEIALEMEVERELFIDGMDQCWTIAIDERQAVKH